ncbi:MAG TPA: PHB depolymerase family esterase [Isosphaeraceae bacterium]|nr:PHB depolymerase family esterase [Isosphaeraceae bacterium]
MARDPAFPWRLRSGLVLGAWVLVGAWAPCQGDTVFLKNGLVFISQGTPDKDNSLVYIWDGLKRVVVRDSKIDKTVADNALRTGERFTLVQPIVVLGGSMPKEVLSVEAGPWDERGRRRFRYLGSKSARPLSMEQAIIEIGPHIVRYRGVDGFWWPGLVETNQVPRPVMMALLGRVEQSNAGERERVVRFLMDAGWYPEAKQELERLIKDFPGTDLSERAAGARVFIIQAEATRRRSEIDQRRKAQQEQAVARLLKTFQDKEISTELQLEVRELERRDAQQRAADKALAIELRALSDRLPSRARAPWQKRLVEVLQAIDEAPDAVRGRFAAWQKAKTDAALTAEGRFALAMSGYVVGHDAAVPDLAGAEALWQARDGARAYLAGGELAERSSSAAQLEGLAWPTAAGIPDPVHRLELLTRLVQLMPPPRHDGQEAPGKTILHRVLEDQNAEPTEYAVRLPPEYHPLRYYPTLIVLHSGNGPAAAIDEWAAEADRHGYVLVAPEYNLRGQPHDYRYTTSEHAAVELALRDARKRYAIDSDRVFVAGQLIGGNMAWDYALAHPDLFAGVVVISGLPAKYVPKYLPHHERLPLFYVIGDLAPAANEVVFSRYVKPAIQKTWDILYVEYFRRGLETFPEEIPRAFDWMDRHHRDPYPKAFKAVSARTSDDRFYGVVIREFKPGFTTAPEAADILGQNLNPAEIKMSSSSLSNLIRLDVKGVRRLDVWLSPKLIDFKRKPEIRINGRSYFKGQVKLEFEPMLEDLRIRGDRRQVYWHRVAAE